MKNPVKDTNWKLVTIMRAHKDRKAWPSITRSLRGTSYDDWSGETRVSKHRVMDLRTQQGDAAEEAEMNTGFRIARTKR